MREKSTLDLTRAIRSQVDEQYILDRTRGCLRLYYEPEMQPEEKAAMIEEYRKALAKFPKWAVAGAFDDWIARHHRRPSPGELAMLAKGRMEPITSELARREKAEREQREYKQSLAAARPSPEQAKEILERAGFTPSRISAVQRAPMATTFDDAEELANRGSKLPHWSETADPDGPEMQALRKGRDENPLIQAARKAAGNGGAA